MITDAEHEQIDKWVQGTLMHPKNLCTEPELTEQANAAFIAFRKADGDNSNQLSIPELLRLCEEMGLPAEKDEEEMLMKIDSDDSGEIDITEWMTFWLKRISCLPNPAKQQEAIARNTFKKFDKDGSGYLDLEELRALIDSLGAKFTDKEMADALKELDSDGSGQIEESEFISWWVNRSLNARAGGGLIAMKLKKLARKAAQLFFTDIFTAVWKNDVSLVKTFLEGDARMASACDSSEYGDGWMPLHYACYQGFGDIVDELLTAGAKVDVTNDLGFSPLFYAAQNNHVHICKVLVDKGADPTIAGATKDEPNIFMCPVDHVVDSPELMKLFRSHPRCHPPLAPPAEKVVATISESGLMVVEIPPSKLFTVLPIKKWRVVVSTGPTTPSARLADGLMEVITPGANPNQGQREFAGKPDIGGSPLQISFAVDRRWLKGKVGGDWSHAALFVRLAPINSFADEGPLSDPAPVAFQTALDQASGSRVLGQPQSALAAALELAVDDVQDQGRDEDGGGEAYPEEDDFGPAASAPASASAAGRGRSRGGQGGGQGEGKYGEEGGRLADEKPSSREEKDSKK